MSQDQSNARDWIRLFGAISYLILTAISLIANILLLMVIIKGRKQFSKMPFFIISLQMLIADFLCLVFVHVLVSIPTTFAGKQIYSDIIVQYFTTMDTVYYNCFLFQNLLLTLNRFCVFLWKTGNHILFETKFIYLMISFIWLFVILLTIALNLVGRTKTFNAQEFHLQLVVSNVTQDYLSTQILQKFTDITSLYLPRFNLLIYIVIFIEIKFNVTYLIKHGKKLAMPQKNSKKEINILLQSVIIIFAFELEDWTYYAIAWFGDPGGDATYFIAFAQTWAGLLLNTIHAIIIFLFTSLAKAKLREIFGMKHGITEISQTQFAKSNQGRLMRAKSEPVVVLPSMRNVVLKATSNQTRF